MSSESISSLLLVVYFLFCIGTALWSTRPSVVSYSPIEYFVGDRRVGDTKSAIVLTGVALVGFGPFQHLGQIQRDGFPYAMTSLAIIAMALLGIVLLPRQWMVAKRFGFVTPGEAIADYYQCPSFRSFVMTLGLIVAIVIVSIQVVIGGSVIAALLHEHISYSVGIFVFAMMSISCQTWTGSRATTLISIVQFSLFTLGVMIVIVWVLVELGGVEPLGTELATTGRRPDQSFWGRTDSGHNSFLSIPSWNIREHGGVFGGPWNPLLILTYTLSMVGLYVSPNISLCAFSSRSTRAFRIHGVWLLPVVGGMIVAIFFVTIGVGTRYIFDLGEARADNLGDVRVGLFSFAALSDSASAFIQQIYERASRLPYWLSVFCAIATVGFSQAVCAVFGNTAATMISRDLFKAVFFRNLSHRSQISVARIASAAIVVVGAAVAALSPGQTFALGAIAAACSLQLLPALFGLCWLPGLSRAGVGAGVIVGIAVALLTDPGVLKLLTNFGARVPWEPWPLSVHGSVWGLGCNIVVAALVSMLNRDELQRRHRDRIHRMLHEYSSRAAATRGRTSTGWILTVVWTGFAIGPGVVIGNRVFGDPAAEIDGWRLGVPSLWGWLIVWWLLGAALAWYLGYRLRLFGNPRRSIEPLLRDAADSKT